MKDLESLDAAFVIDTFLLLLIGIGPKIVLVPFLEATAAMPEAVKRRGFAQDADHRRHCRGALAGPRRPADQAAAFLAGRAGRR